MGLFEVVVLVAFAVVTVLQLVLLFRKPRFDTPPDLQVRLGALEQQVLALTQASTRAEVADGRIEQQLLVFTDQTRQQLDLSRLALDEQLAKTVAESRQGRQELTDHLGAFRTEMTTTLKQLSEETVASRSALTQSSAAFEQQIQDRFTQQFAALQDTVSQQLRHMTAGSQQNSEQLRTALNERLAAIQADNASKLEEMRRTVDEKLHATLEQRLGDSFKLVSERLEQVHAGLGEMKSLAGSVGDLKRVMTNVRARGTWGEVQLGAIIESLMTAEQYDKNVKTVPGSNDLVEYAVRMPGKTGDQVVWLPIDSKYPVEHYQRLVDAHEQADKALVQQAASAFEASIRLEAKKIASKYVSPPHTTDFAVLFVPTEGLFAEVCRIPGMVEALQNDFRVVVAGPTTLSAMLNSLRLGFRTLAIEKRSSEVWNILSAVKTEFRKFGDIVDATHKSIDAAAKKFGDIGVRSRAIERKLRDVEELPGQAAAPLVAADVLGLDDPETD